MYNQLSIVKMRQIYYRYSTYIQASSMLLVGIMIYLLYRPHNLLVFNIVDALGLGHVIDNLRLSFSVFQLPPIVIKSLPAGLWTVSYLMMMFVTTKFHTRRVRLMLALPLPIAAIVLEFMQFWGWCPGTFDIYDLICYAIPLIIFIKSI